MFDNLRTATVGECKKRRAMGEFEQMATRPRPQPRSRAALALVVPLALLCNLACADILGIDPPTSSDSQSGAAGKNSSSAGVGGALDEAGSGPLGGAAGEAGEAAGAAGEGHRMDGGAGHAGSSVSLYIDGPALTTVCPGTSVEIPLVAKGGTPPYRWKLISPSAPFALHAADPNDNQATLSGTPASTDDYDVQIRVTDAASAQFTRDFTVHVPSVPVITLKNVPSVCPNELYSTVLTAEGGDPTTYKWSSDLPPATGISIQEDKLKGQFLGATGGATHADFTLRVQDGGSCASEPVSLSLTFEQPTASVCPEVRVVGQLNGLPPPAPCLGNAYDETLGMLRGKGAFSWSSDSAPPGLSFDPLTQKISGVSTGPGTLEVHATDLVTKRTIVQSFDLQPRDKCWLAYLGKEASTQRLHFFDALLSDGAGGVGWTKTLENNPVSDFKFSPDGKYLAYRKGQSGAPMSLSIVKLGTWQEGPIDVTNASQYEWSPDSTALAVVDSRTEGTVLGWVDIVHPLPATTSAPLVFQSMQTVPASVDSAVQWFDTNHLAFFSPLALGVDSLSRTTAGSSGFVAPETSSDFYFFAGDRLRPAAHGVFVISSLLKVFFFGSDGSTAVSHENEPIAPSGRYLARAQQGSLLLFRATDPGSDVHPHQTSTGCDTILSWAAGAERIACAHQTGQAQDELTFFDVNPNTDDLSTASVLTLQGSRDLLSQRRRQFSADGSLFAYTTDSALAIATVGVATPTVRVISLDASASNTLSELAFAPNGGRLLLHRGAQLSSFDLRNPALTETPAESVLPAALGCVEDSTGLSAGYCGLERPDSTLVWAPSSNLTAYQSVTGELEVEDFTWQQRGIYQTLHVNANCTGQCVVSGQFAFQP